MLVGKDNEVLGSNQLGWGTIAGLSFVSLVYFADILLNASLKCFWFDELFTVYLCRLPSFKNTWYAAVNGADFNPPLFYLLTRASQRVFGDGLISMRLPAITGVWLFGVCLFLFVTKRTNVVSGLVAGMFPFFTLARYYAYEARAHGTVLGWCGLTLLCWQRSSEGAAKYLWLTGFGLSLMGALFTHVYAVYLLFPFVLVEVYSLYQRKRPRWDILAIMVLALASAAASAYLPLLRAFRTSIPAVFFPPSHEILQRFLIRVIGPALVVLLLSLVLLTLGRTVHARRAMTITAIPQQDLVVAVGFVCIPLVGFVGCKISHGPFVDRYFLATIAGYAVLLGFASCSPQISSWSSKALAGCMLLLMVADLGATVYLSMKHRLPLVEPSSGLVLSTAPADPMKSYKTLASYNGNLDVLVLSHLEYIYFFKYAPSSVVSRLSFGASPGDLYLKGYERLAKLANIGLRVTSFEPFMAVHDRFKVYGSGSGEDLEAIRVFTRAGYKMVSAQLDTEGVMYEYEK
jgi:hypothetical protein